MDTRPLRVKLQRIALIALAFGWIAIYSNGGHGVCAYHTWSCIIISFIHTLFELGSATHVIVLFVLWLNVVLGPSMHIWGVGSILYTASIGLEHLYTRRHFSVCDVSSWEHL